jgi:hypothetical protein
VGIPGAVISGPSTAIDQHDVPGDPVADANAVRSKPAAGSMTTSRPFQANEYLHDLAAGRLTKNSDHQLPRPVIAAVVGPLVQSVDLGGAAPSTRHPMYGASLDE